MATNSSRQRAASQGVPGQGKSNGAECRRKKAAIGNLYSGVPGQMIKMSRDVYRVANDVSFRYVGPR